MSMSFPIDHHASSKKENLAKKTIESIRGKESGQPFCYYKFIFKSDGFRDSVWHFLSMLRSGEKYIYLDSTGLAKGIAANFK